MKSKILLMYATEYDIKGEDGRQVTGCTLNYYFYGEHGEALKAIVGDKGSVGYQRAKCSIDYVKRAAIVKAPAIYEADFVMVIGSDGKPVMKVENLQYVQDVNFVPVERK